MDKVLVLGMKMVSRKEPGSLPVHGIAVLALACLIFQVILRALVLESPEDLLKQIYVHHVQGF